MRKQIREHLVHRNTVLYSWIISYLIILCLPFCISSILMQLLIQSVRQETQEAYRNELLNTQILLDEKLSEMSRMALEFSLNKEVDRLVSAAGGAGKKAKALLRINPGISAHTHEYIMTSKPDSKFGIYI